MQETVSTPTLDTIFSLRELKQVGCRSKTRQQLGIRLPRRISAPKGSHPNGGGGMRLQGWRCHFPTKAILRKSCLSFVVKIGSVEIRLGTRLLDTLSEHSIFGKMALIDPGPRNATAVAATHTTLVPVDEKQFLLMVSRTPYFALNVMRILAIRLSKGAETQGVIV